MIRLDAATVLLQWATGGLAFLWVTSRRREVSLGYGWLLRGTYGLMALGALFLGRRYGDEVIVRDVAGAMLLGHWYRVQPCMPRGPLLEMVRWIAVIWPFELIVMLWPVGMGAVITGEIDDGYNGILGWMWIACSITTIALVGVTR